MTNTKIPGLSFSLKRAVGITAAKRAFTKATGIPTTKTGIERKIGAAVIGMIFGKKIGMFTFSQLEVLYGESSYRIYE